MKYEPERHHQRSISLKGYDYSQPWVYFVTIFTQDRACLFGEMVDGQVRMNKYGKIAKIVEGEWMKSATLRPRVTVDEFVVMPNHSHGIITLADGNRRGTSTVGAQCNVPLHSNNLANRRRIQFQASFACSKQLLTNGLTSCAARQEHLSGNGIIMNTSSAMANRWIKSVNTS